MLLTLTLHTGNQVFGVTHVLVSVAGALAADLQSLLVTDRSDDRVHEAVCPLADRGDCSSSSKLMKLPIECGYIIVVNF